MIERLRDSDLSVLITGESGVGKELIARAIHYHSPRARRPFIALNCAALPDSLVESELFGIERGVATGAEARIGKFEAAVGGTLFLDEIGDLSLTAQAKILRVLQERVVERVGGRKVIPLDVRVLAATNKDLATAIKNGTFREDLYYRLNVVHIHAPPLREQRDDIPLLANTFLTKFCQELGREPKKLGPEAVRLLKEYPWPGNVRELENEMKRAVALCPRKVITAEDLSEAVRSGSRNRALKHLPSVGALRDQVEALQRFALERDLFPGSATVSVASGASGTPALPGGIRLKTAIERQRIVEALHARQHNQLQAAKILGLSRQGLMKKMKRYGIGRG